MKRVLQITQGASAGDIIKKGVPVWVGGVLKIGDGVLSYAELPPIVFKKRKQYLIFRKIALPMYLKAGQTQPKQSDINVSVLLGDDWPALPAIVPHSYNAAGATVFQAPLKSYNPLKIELKIYGTAPAVDKELICYGYFLQVR